MNCARNEWQNVHKMKEESMLLQKKREQEYLLKTVFEVIDGGRMKREDYKNPGR